MGASRDDFIKYPRTPHLFGSKGTDDDKRLGRKESEAFIAAPSLIVEEKIDGTNVGIHFTTRGRMVLQCRGHEITEGMHPQYDLFKQWTSVKPPCWRRCSAAGSSSTANGSTQSTPSTTAPCRITSSSSTFTTRTRRSSSTSARVCKCSTAPASTPCPCSIAAPPRRKNCARSSARLPLTARSTIPSPAGRTNQGTVIQNAREQCREHLRAGRSFAFNATNITRQMRGRWIDLLADYGARIEIAFVEPPLPVLKAQNKRRPSPVPEVVIDRLVQKLEPPTIIECHGLTLADPTKP